MGAAFEDDRVYKEVFTDKYNGKNSVYIYSNELILSRIKDYEKMKRDTAGITVLFSTKRGNVMLFSSPVQVNAVTKFGIDKAVVVKNLKIKKNGSEALLFMTTNLMSKEWQRNHSEDKFYKFNCYLIFKDSQWIIKNVEMENCAFKEL